MTKEYILFMKKTFLVKDDFVDSRVDRWFKRNVYNVPQSLIEKNLRQGRIKIKILIIRCKEELHQSSCSTIPNFILP